ncbi:MAG: class I SAM-dependent methyltransferase [Rhodoferax sp.]
MPDLAITPLLRDMTPPSDWVLRWSHLVAPRGSVLDVACGHGRHMRWFAERGHPVTGIDRSTEAIARVAAFGTAVLADIENGAWPLIDGAHARQFAAVIVTNYLWRPLLPRILESIAPGGLVVYETFSEGHETVGRPTRPDFLLRPGELLKTFADLRVLAFEEGFVEGPPRFLQRIVAVRPESADTTGQTPVRYAL